MLFALGQRLITSSATQSLALLSDIQKSHARLEILYFLKS